jgi:DNA mismatch endonuclease (patch repair protein)
MDNLTKDQRKKNMTRIRSEDTKMEVRVRSALHRRGLRFRKNVRTLVGKPDIVFPSTRVAVFLDSCFWHQCRYHSNLPKTRMSYWLPKLARNKIRDKAVKRELRKQGWTVLRFWEHQIQNDIDGCVNKIVTAVHERS